jgi:hypothetical protein
VDRVTARGLVAAKVEDPEQTRFTATQYNTALDLAQQQFSIDARSIIEAVNVVLVANQAEYTLPSDFLVMIMCRANGLKLAPTTKYELSFQTEIDWTTLPAGTPTAVYMDEQNGKFGLVPVPDSNNAALPFVLDYIGIPAPMTQDTGGGSAGNLLNNITILQYYAMAVVNWAAYEMLSYVPMTDDVIKKRSAIMADYKTYTSQAITTYNNMTDEPLQMRGGQQWADMVTKVNDTAFSE